MGINRTELEICSMEEGDFHSKVHLKNKRDYFLWILVAVYGSAQPQCKDVFLSELVRACNHESLPMLIGGDFNIIRRPEEKSNDNFEARWPFLLFNAVIDSLDLREIELSGRQYTWANSLEVPTFEKLALFRRRRMHLRSGSPKCSGMSSNLT